MFRLPFRVYQSTAALAPVAGGGGGGGVAMVWNAADQSGVTLTNANRTATRPAGASYVGIRATPALDSAGAWALAVTTGGTVNSDFGFGLANASHVLTNYLGSSAHGTGWYQSGNVYKSAAPIATIATYVSGNTLLMKAKIVSGNWHLWLKKTTDVNWNNSGAADPETGVGGLNTGIASGTAVYPAFIADLTGDALTIVDYPQALGSFTDLFD